MINHNANPNQFRIGSLVRFIAPHVARVYDYEDGRLVDVVVPENTIGTVRNHIEVDYELPRLMIEVEHESRGLIRVLVKADDYGYTRVEPVQWALDLD